MITLHHGARDGFPILGILMGCSSPSSSEPTNVPSEPNLLEAKLAMTIAGGFAEKARWTTKCNVGPCEHYRVGRKVGDLVVIDVVHPIRGTLRLVVDIEAERVVRAKRVTSN